MSTRDNILNDPRLSPTAAGVGAYIADHADPVALALILGSFRDAPLAIARALDELEAHGHVRRIGEADWSDVRYMALPATPDGVSA